MRFAAVLLLIAVLDPQGAPVDQPSVTVRGRIYTPQSILSRNMGSEADQTTAFPPHKVIGNIYYVGTRTLSSFLITTPQGHILINSTYERNDALVKELTGAQVVIVQEDVPALEAIRPGGKKHPIDRTLRDGEQVTLGGSTLVAHLTPGHTHGCTTWTMKAQDAGRSFDVVFACSYRAPANVTPDIEKEFNRTFQVLRSLPCDVPLGDHPAQYDMTEKYARRQAGSANPFVDPAGCWLEADIQEAMLRAQLQWQQRPERPR
jgi:metallo-beta-lactamase class B